MFTNDKSEPTQQQIAIDRLYEEMAQVAGDSDEYFKLTAQLKVLTDVKAQEAAPSMSPDNIALILSNLAGILLILNHERAGVVASKALSFVMKLR